MSTFIPHTLSVLPVKEMKNGTCPSKEKDEDKGIDM